MKNNSFLIRIFLACIFAILTFGGVCPAQKKNPVYKNQEVRFFWYSKVSEEVFLSSRKRIDLDERDPRNIVEGINILLTFEGDKKKANFCGATDMGYNSPEVECTVEVAALFYASYIFYGKGWDYFATGVALVEDGKKNDPKTIKKAFQLYKEWLKKIKKVGIEKARMQNLDPLKGTGIVWY